LANFNIESDDAGHTLIVDPPVVNNLSDAGGQPGPTPSSTIASAPNQTLTGSALRRQFCL
jgi:hypothetical protein